MNIVEFAESILGHELSEYQKEYLNTCYEYILQNKQLYYIPSRGTIKYMPHKNYHSNWEEQMEEIE